MTKQRTTSHIKRYGKDPGMPWPGLFLFEHEPDHSTSSPVLAASDDAAIVEEPDVRLQVPGAIGKTRSLPWEERELLPLEWRSLQYNRVVNAANSKPMSSDLGITTDLDGFFELAGRSLDDDSDGPIEPDWTQEEIVLLHCRLLEEIKLLSIPTTPLDDKIDIVRWVFAEKELDDKAFSFVNCLHFAANSRCSPFPFCGLVDPEEIRDWIKSRLRYWFGNAFDAYPLWIREAIAQSPAWVTKNLSKNPQWINQQIRQHNECEQGNLFA